MVAAKIYKFFTEHGPSTAAEIAIGTGLPFERVLSYVCEHLYVDRDGKKVLWNTTPFTRGKE